MVKRKRKMDLSTIKRWRCFLCDETFFFLEELDEHEEEEHKEEEEKSWSPKKNGLQT